MGHYDTGYSNTGGRAYFRKKEYHPFLYHILEACYEVKPDDEMLTAVLGYLIRSQCFGAKYHHWYELGIEREIRITSLYEAYLLSLDGRKLERVQRCFSCIFSMTWIVLAAESGFICQYYCGKKGAA